MKISGNLNLIEVWDKFILNGDQDALSVIYFQYYDLLFDYGLRHTTDRQLVEDVIQDIFISLIKHRKSIGIVKSLKGYLISTFRRRLVLNLDKKKKTILTPTLPEEHFDYFKSPVDDESEIDKTERIYSTIRQSIAKLTDKQREIIYLRFEREISYEEISVMLNISVDSCYKSTYRSIKSIRFEVEKILGKGTKIFFMILFRSIRNQ